jgi:hypothetical protein
MKKKKKSGELLYDPNKFIRIEKYLTWLICFFFSFFYDYSPHFKNFGRYRRGIRVEKGWWVQHGGVCHSAASLGGEANRIS